MACSRSLVCCLGLMLLLGFASAADQYRFMARRSTPSNDIDCNAKEMPSGKPVSYCKICSGGIAALADACSANSACKGFDIEGNGYCGYLKAASGPGKMVYTEGFGSFCKVGAGACSGDWNVVQRTSIEGSDLDCGGKDYQGNRVSYCKIFGDPTKVADACKANPSCKAFTIVNNSEGYLKTSTGPTKYMESATTYVPA